MTDNVNLLTPLAPPDQWRHWRQGLLQELERLQKLEALQEAGSALGWIQQMRACTLKNMRLSQSCLVLVLKGKKVLLSGNVQRAEVLEGSGVFLPAGDTVSCINTPMADKEYLALTVSFAPPLLDRLRQRLATDEAPDAIKGAGATRDMTPLLQCVHTFLRLLPAEDDPMLPLMQQEQMAYLLWKFGLPIFSGPHHLVNEIRAMVETTPQNDWSPSELAERLCMTERTLRRRLAGLGASPSELVRVSRLHYGLNLLMRGRMRVSEVASHCGYSSPSRFAARFRELFGVTPAEVQSSGKKVDQRTRKSDLHAFRP